MDSYEIRVLQALKLKNELTMKTVNAKIIQKLVLTVLHTEKRRF